MSPEAIVVASAVQVGVILALAVAVGQYTAPRVGFTSHVVNRVTDGSPLLEGVRGDSKPALGLGAGVGGLLVVAERFAPEVVDADGYEMTFESLLQSIPLRVLYGGITEEILIRWGAMALIAFVLWRVVGRRTERPSNAIMWSSIVLAAVLFGLLHLPVATTIYGPLTPEVLTFIVGLNAVGGGAFGWLFWRYSLEAAILAHAFAHVVAVTVWVGLLL